MRVKLKGIASATKILASGEKVTYHYAWRGGPRLDGEPGSPEFMLSYERALHERRSPDSSVFKSIITDYLASADFTGLRERTKADYQKHIATIEQAFADLPTAALTDPKVTGEFLHWRDRIGGRQGDYAWSVLMLILSHGRTVGLTSYRPPGRIRKLYEADRSDKIWETHHIDAFSRLHRSRCNGPWCSPPKLGSARLTFSVCRGVPTTGCIYGSRHQRVSPVRSRRGDLQRFPFQICYGR